MDSPRPEEAMSARDAMRQGLEGWLGPDEEIPPPPVPLPRGRGGPQHIPRPYNARPGGAPPWVDVAPEKRRPTLHDVWVALASLGPAVPSERERPGSRSRPSAVLAPVYEEDASSHVVLTRRTLLLRDHAGDVSFPGGRVETGEGPLDGALREAQEEIDLDPARIEIIGELDHLATVSNDSFIVPYVGALRGRPETRPNPHEVDAVLHVPLAELADPAIYREEIWTFPNGEDRAMHFFELVGDTVWGATAVMLRQLLGIVTGTLGRGS